MNDSQTTVMVRTLSDLAKVPAIHHPSDVGFDLYLDRTVALIPNERQDVSTGIAIAMPPTIYGRITGRSSSIRRNLLVYEGIIDPGFRGQLFAAVLNTGPETVWLETGDRIAQVVFAPAIRPQLVEVTDDEWFARPTDRGEAGFGSSGR